MSLVPCRDCRRHVRADAACCPFCGGEKSAPRPEVSPEVALSRGAMAVLAGTGVAIAFEVSACGVYGAPPPRIEAPDGTTHAFEVQRTDVLDGRAANVSLMRRAVAAGCDAEPYRTLTSVVVRCGDVYFKASAGAHAWTVTCTAADEAACRSTFEHVLNVPDPDAPSSEPADAGSSEPADAGSD